MTRPKIALGRMLFFEKRLSADGTISCAACHIPRRGFTNGRQYGIGIGGRIGLRNVPTIFNTAYNKRQFWDGRAKTLEEQAIVPMMHPAEMGATPERVALVLGALPAYRAAFRRAFGTDKITLDHAVNAIASFERSILSGGSPFDRWKYGGEKNAISPAAKRGFSVFMGRGNCMKCHLVGESSALFTDNQFHNIGVGAQANPPHPGREKITGRANDWGKFKTPSLRERVPSMV